MKITKSKIFIFLLLIFLIASIICVCFFIFQGKSQKNQHIQSYQEEIIQNAENHDASSKRSNINPSENIVTITTYSRELFNRTEYALGIKYSDFKNLNTKSGELKNESTQISLSTKNFINEVMIDARNGNVSALVKLTDPAIIKMVGEGALVKKYSAYCQYFQDYKSQDISNGFTTTLTDNSFILLESFTDSLGGGEMYGFVVSQTGLGNFIDDIFPGETSIIVAFPPNQNKSPIIIVNPISGFNRQNLAEVDGNALIPNSWFFRHETKNGTEAYFISKEEIVGSSGIFETGLTLNVIQQQNIPGGNAEDYMNSYADLYIKKYPNFSDKTGQAGDLVYRELTGVRSDADSTWKEVFRLVANKKTNTFYVVIFESPTEKWYKEWYVHGKNMIDYFSLDPAY